MQGGGMRSMRILAQDPKVLDAMGAVMIAGPGINNGQATTATITISITSSGGPRAGWNRPSDIKGRT
jgi:hypothetical protein